MKIVHHQVSLSAANETASRTPQSSRLSIVVLVPNQPVDPSSTAFVTISQTCPDAWELLACSLAPYFKDGGFSHVSKRRHWTRAQLHCHSSLSLRCRFVELSPLFLSESRMLHDQLTHSEHLVHLGTASQLLSPGIITCPRSTHALTCLPNPHQASNADISKPF